MIEGVPPRAPSDGHVDAGIRDEDPNSGKHLCCRRLHGGGWCLDRIGHNGECHGKPYGPLKDYVSIALEHKGLVKPQAPKPSKP